MIALTQRRGDTFDYTVPLLGGWLGATFTGGMKFTLRVEPPPSSEVTDTAAVYQASTAGGQITGSGASVRIQIPASVTTLWPTGKLLADMQGVVSGATPQVYTIDSGTVTILADVTRST